MGTRVHPPVGSPSARGRGRRWLSYVRSRSIRRSIPSRTPSDRCSVEKPKGPPNHVQPRTLSLFAQFEWGWCLTVIRRTHQTYGRDCSGNSASDAHVLKISQVRGRTRPPPSAAELALPESPWETSRIFVIAGSGMTMIY